MCSQYWNLNTILICPKCKEKSLWNLQTHFMGDFGSCSNFYKLKQKIPELGGVTVDLTGENNDFIGSCEKCGQYFDLGAKIEKGKVINIYFLKNNKYNTSKIA